MTKETLDRLLFKSSLYIVGALHIGILILFNSFTHNANYLLAPLYIFTAVFILINQRKQSKNLYYAFIIVALFGFIIEAIAIDTGSIFGEYEYTSSLSLQLLNVPILSGLYWALSVFCIGSFVRGISKILLIRVLIGGVLFVLQEILVELCNIQLEVWRWLENSIPLQNYIGTFFVAVFLLTIMFLSKFKRGNRIAPSVFIIQIIFYLLVAFII